MALPHPVVALWASMEALVLLAAIFVEVPTGRDSVFFHHACVSAVVKTVLYETRARL